MDAFLKTTHEVLGPLNLATAHDRLTRFEFVYKDRRVCRATYGEGAEATVVVVNDSPSPAPGRVQAGRTGRAAPLGVRGRRSSVRGVSGPALEWPRVPRGGPVHPPRGGRARPVARSAASGSFTALAIPGSTGEGRPTRSAARRSSRSPGKSRGLVLGLNERLVSRPRVPPASIHGRPRPSPSGAARKGGRRSSSRGRTRPRSIRPS